MEVEIPQSLPDSWISLFYDKHDLTEKLFVFATESGSTFCHNNGGGLVSLCMYLEHEN